MAQKESVEIRCSSCGANFRLWLPVGLVSEWGGGEEIGCIKCGAKFLLKRGEKGVEVESLAAGKEAAEPARAVEDDKEKVLFVDDDKLSLAIIESTFADMDIKCVMTRSAEEALGELEKNHFSLVVTDLHLKNPEDPATKLDGEDLLKRMIAARKKIPAIVITGKDIVDDIAMDTKWYELNVKGFIQKGNPFWSEELKQKIREVLELV